MRNRHRALQLAQAICLVVTMGMIASAGAGMFGLGEETWQEEVRLHDGRTMIVERTVTRGGRHEIGQPPPIKEQTITFTLPGSGTRITWTSEYGDDLGRTNFVLLAVHVLNGVPYIVAEPNLCLAYNKWGRPNPPYVIFRYDGAAWQRIPLEELPAEFTTLNVAISLDSQHVREMVQLGVVPAEDIRRRNSRLLQPEYKIILREAVRPDGISQTSCPIPTTAAAQPIAPELDGKPLFYNWWPLAQDWLSKTYGKSK